MTMFGKMLGVLAAAVAVLAFAPAVASATTAVPALHATDYQAYLLDTSGVPIASSSTVTLAGRLRLDWAATLECDTHLTMVVHADGTTTITGGSFTNCTVSVPNCNMSMVPNLNMGDRFVLDANGDFRDRINVSLTNTFSGAGCPFGPIAMAGELSPRLDFDGSGALTATFDGAAAGSLSSALGSFTATGTLTEQGTPGGYGLGI